MISTLLAQSSFFGIDVPENFDVAQNLAFAVIAALMIYMSFKMVTTGNVVHAALYLVIVLAGSAAMFILLGSDFVGATQVLVYIGAIIVLFLFGIMLTKAQLGDDDSVEHERRTMGSGVAILLFVVLAFALVDSFGATDIEFSNPEPVEYVETSIDIDDLPTPVLDVVPAAILAEGERITIPTDVFETLSQSVQLVVPGAEFMIDEDVEDAEPEFIRYVETEVQTADLPAEVTGALPGTLLDESRRITIPTEVFAGFDPEVQRRVPGAEVFGNNKQIADSIFSNYIVAFESVSVLLLAALIGAIVVARKE